MDEYRRTVRRTQAQLGMTMSTVEHLIALHRGDQQKAAEAAKTHAGFANIIAELEAKGGRNFGRGDIIKLDMSNLATGTVSGWASTSSLDLYGHKILRGAFSQSIRERGLTGPRSIKLLLDHSWMHPAGVITTLEYRGDNLWMDAQLDLNVGYVKDRYSVMQMAGGFNFSVGFMLQDHAFKEDANGNEYLEIQRGDLFEISIVLFPGNEEATMTSVLSRGKSAFAGFDLMAAKLASFQDKLETLMRKQG